jgi:hypothetical protein
MELKAHLLLLASLITNGPWMGYPGVGTVLVTTEGQLESVGAVDKGSDAPEQPALLQQTVSCIVGASSQRKPVANVSAWQLEDVVDEYMITRYMAPYSVKWPHLQSQK